MQLKTSAVFSAVSVINKVCLGLYFGLLLPWSAFGSETGNLELPIQGITVSIDGNGTWQKIFATGVQPVEFPDRRGINTAQKIAEQRAKAEIIRFFQQDVTSETVMKELESTSQTSNQLQGSSGAAFSKESQRALATSLSETIRSFSSGTLRGLVVLEVGYDDKREEAYVKVGISRKSIGLSANIKEDIENPDRDAGVHCNKDCESGSGILKAPSEVRKGPKLP